MTAAERMRLAIQRVRHAQRAVQHGTQRALAEAKTSRAAQAPLPAACPLPTYLLAQTDDRPC